MVRFQGGSLFNLKLIDKNYELLEHTADISIKVKAKDLEGLFRQSALAMFDIIARKLKNRIKSQREIKIRQRADDLDELFVNWLNELLSLSSAKGLIFTDFKFKELKENLIEAIAVAESIEHYKPNSEIKAATYHELKIEKNKSGWQAQVIFDV